MSGDPATIPRDGPADSVELPRPTAAPMVLALGLALIAVGVATSLAFVAVGAAVLLCGLGIWVAQLTPGRGHVHEPLAGPPRAGPVTTRAGVWRTCTRGCPAIGSGYRPRCIRSPPASGAGSSAGCSCRSRP